MEGEKKEIKEWKMRVKRREGERGTENRGNMRSHGVM